MADLKCPPKCRSTKTALCNKVYVVCTYLLCLVLHICERASKGKVSLSFLEARTKTTPTEPILHRTH